MATAEQHDLIDMHIDCLHPSSSSTRGYGETDHGRGKKKGHGRGQLRHILPAPPSAKPLA